MSMAFKRAIGSCWYKHCSHTRAHIWQLARELQPGTPEATRLVLNVKREQQEEQTL